MKYLNQQRTKIWHQKELYYSAKKIFGGLLARDKEAVKDFITTSTMESIDGSRTIYYVD